MNPLNIKIVIAIAGVLLGWNVASFAEAKTAAIDRVIPSCIDRVAGKRDWLKKTLWGILDQEQGWVGAKVRNRNGSYDLGPLQVNSFWVPRLAAMSGEAPAHIAWWLQHDACFNIESARWIFLSELHVTGDYWKSIGRYHSPSLWRQRDYCLAVYHRLKRRFGTAAFYR